MADERDGETQYYAIVSSGFTAQAPSGLARRRRTGGGFVDESFRRDMSWQRSSVIWDWERDELGRDLVEIDEADALRIIAGWRERWATEDANRR